MRKEFLPYLLPILSLIVLFAIFSFNPGITGFAVKDVKERVSGNVVIFTDSNVVIPLNSIVEVSLDEKTSAIALKDFIDKNGSWYETKTGSLPDIGYYGEGYSGNHNYALSLESLNLGAVENKEFHTIKIRVLFNGKIISETTQEVKK
ncbi:hypothetical protein HYX18_00770 [Candidatus Woesearchaeota archaeon]|nr:hypothetical protein [Candidatus Woesearchaeota archaeon]